MTSSKSITEHPVIDYGASSYASRLTPRAEKGGGLGLPEKEEDGCVVSKKILKLADLIRNAKSCVVLTGAGISTSAGVSDFRGPNGVWTAEKRGVAPPASKSFENVQPTATHMALVGLVKAGLVKLIISQNVDGLHLRSQLPRDSLSELHGNLFVETCEVCGWEYLRDFDIGGISFSKTGRICHRQGCGGALRNTLLDWEDALPEQEFRASEEALRESDLCICMGTSLRIRPASELPLITVKGGGKLVILNLQKTPKDRHAYMRIQAPVDTILEGVMAVLGLAIPVFTRSMSMMVVARHHAPSSTAGCSSSNVLLSQACPEQQGGARVQERKQGGTGWKCPRDEAAYITAQAKEKVSIGLKEEPTGASDLHQQNAGEISAHGKIAEDGKSEDGKSDNATEESWKAVKGEQKDGECAHELQVPSDLEAGLDKKGDGKTQNEKQLWDVWVQSTVGRRCALPLIKGVEWVGALAGEHCEIHQDEGSSRRNAFTGVIAVDCTSRGAPGKVDAEISLEDSCSFPSTMLQVRGEDWHLRRRTGKEMEQLEMEELVNNGEWYFKIDLPVVERDYNTQLQESIVKKLQEEASRAPVNKRKLVSDDVPAAKRSPWRKCATCGKYVRVNEESGFSLGCGCLTK